MRRNNRGEAPPYATKPDGIAAAAAATVGAPDRSIVPGCTVYLRSGSPKMMVLAVKDDVADVVLNVYGTVQMHRDSFPLFALDFVAGPKRT